MAINVTVFALSFLTKDKLLLWGAKVGSPLIFTAESSRLELVIPIHAELSAQAYHSMARMQDVRINDHLNRTRMVAPAQCMSGVPG